MPTYKNEKNNTWFCKFYYRDWQGVNQQKKKEGFKTQREAKEFERKFLEKTKSGCDMLFSAFCEIYIEDFKHRLKPGTIHTKEHAIRYHIMPFFGDMIMSKIEPTHIRKWQNELLEKGYKATYLRTLHRQLSAIFNFAVKYYNLSSNPARTCGSIGSAKPTEEMKFWTLAQFKKFIPCVSDRTARIYFIVLYWSGIREGEGMALKGNDFKFNKNTMRIDENYCKIKGVEYFVPPKTEKSRRRLLMPQFVCNEVKEYINDLYDYHPNDRLFNISKSIIYYQFDQACKKSGLEKIRVHDLRHSHAALCIHLNFSPVLLAERLGHGDVRTTLNTYGHLYQSDRKELVKKLEEENELLVS